VLKWGSGNGSETTGSGGNRRVSCASPRGQRAGKSMQNYALSGLALGKLPIRAFPLGLAGGCFDARAGHNVGVDRVTNQPVFSSPGPVFT
jgi:hypothetical protein